MRDYLGMATAAAQRTGYRWGRAVMARPIKFRQDYCGQVEKLYRLGASEAQLAGFFGVSERTINTWKGTCMTSYRRAVD